MGENDMGIIYKAINKINGKSYIGQTKCPLNTRISQHVYAATKANSNSYFHKAIRKYGPNNFKWVILRNSCIREINDIEIELIRKHDTFNNGYNLTIGGDGVKGLSKENHPCYGKHRSEKTKDKIRMTFEKNGTVCGKNNPMYGKKHTSVSKQKMSKAKKSYWLITYPDGNIKVVDNLMEFCNNNNLCWSHMYNVANGNVSHHKQYKCKKIYEFIIKKRGL